MEELKEKYSEWTNFVATREKARAAKMNNADTAELRQKIQDKKAELLRVRAELQMLEAGLVLAQNGERYNKAAFDAEWMNKKAVLKQEVESLMAHEIQAGVSIPKILKAIGSKNPAWAYSIRENINVYRGADKEDVAQSNWEWSDATSVHRYALAIGPDSPEYTFVLLKGAKDTEFENEECIFDFKTGYFISGNRGVFDSVTESVKAQRSVMLRDILTGVYAKPVKRDHNPYFETTN